MNVLKISLDVNLLRRDNIEENDSIERRVLLARQLENLFVIVFLALFPNELLKNRSSNNNSIFFLRI